MIKVKPLSPEDIDNKELSDELVERVNNLIRMNWNGHSAEVLIDHKLYTHTKRVIGEQSVNSIGNMVGMLKVIFLVIVKIIKQN
jgi:hypothetical protein